MTTATLICTPACTLFVICQQKETAIKRSIWWVYRGCAVVIVTVADFESGR